MRKQVIHIVILLLLFGGTAMAQDIHYSQFYNSPLTLNPALAGKVYGTYRIAFNYRAQWIGLVKGESTYTTPSLSVDVPIRFKSKDILGVGMYLLNDRTSGGRLTNITAMVNLAYHKALGAEKNHVISVGLQAGYVARRLNLSDIRLGDQVNQNIDVSADQLNDKTRYFDMNTGLHWNSKFSEKVNIYLGYSLFHLLQPKASFINGDFGVPMRNVITGGADFLMGKYVSLLPSVVYMRQGTASQTNAGLAIDFAIGKTSHFGFGGYYRVKDAIIPYLNLRIKGFGLGVSYDINASELQGSNGSIEISLSYIGKYIPVPDVKPTMYCPRF